MSPNPAGAHRRRLVGRLEDVAVQVTRPPRHTGARKPPREAALQRVRRAGLCDRRDDVPTEIRLGARAGDPCGTRARPAGATPQARG